MPSRILLCCLFLATAVVSDSRAELFTYTYTGLPYGIAESDTHPYTGDMRFTATFSIDTEDNNNLFAQFTNQVSLNSSTLIRGKVERNGVRVFISQSYSSINDGIREWTIYNFPGELAGRTRYYTGITTDDFGNIEEWGFLYNLSRSLDDIHGPPRYAGSVSGGSDTYTETLGPYDVDKTNTPNPYFERTTSRKSRNPWSRNISTGESVTPIQLSFDQDTPFDGIFGKDKTLFTPDKNLITDGNQIGFIEQSDGQSIVTRADGTSFIIQDGTPIFEGDIVETFDNGVVNIHFIDDSQFAISEDSRLSIDEYIFDPATNEDSTDFSVLKGIFLVFPELIGREEPDDLGINTPHGSIGFRGSADDGELINPNTGEPVEFGDGTKIADLDTSAFFESGSPVTLYTVIDVPDEAFTLSFDFAFFDDPEATIEVVLGDSVIGTILAENYELGEYGIAEFQLLNTDSDTDLAELAFTYDGFTGSQAFFDNVAIAAEGYAGVPNGDFEEFDNGWFTRGEGQVLLGAVQVIFVPEPSTTMLALLSSIGLFFVMSRSKRHELVPQS